MDFEKLKFIDCHSHPHDKKFVEAGVDIDMMMQEMAQMGGATIAIGTDYTETEKAILFAKKYPNCWATIGIHPADNHAEIFDEEKFSSFLTMGNGTGVRKVVGVGECGLDYYYFDKNLKENPLFNIEKEKERQKQLFISQINFALENDLPLVLHGRPSRNSMDAYREMLDILENITFNTPEARPREWGQLRGHVHFFVGNLEIAERFLKIDFLISFDGPITFTNEYDNVIRKIPLEKLMIETDSPYAAPMPYRGQLNFPKYVLEVAKKIAELKNITQEEVLQVTRENTIKLFSLSKIKA